MIQVRSSHDEATVREALVRVLEREEIGADPAEPGALARWLGKLFDLSFGGSDSIAWVFVAIAATVAVFIAVATVRRFSGRSGDGRTARSLVADDARKLRVAELTELARQAERDGDLALALRLHLFALVVALGEHGDLEFHDAWTNRELLERGRPRAAVRTRLEALLAEVDPRTFGKEPARTEDVRRLEAAAAELLGGSAA